MNKEKVFLLNNGIEIPSIGFGTYKAADGNQARMAVAQALAAGYRHIDTASVYGNEESVGRAIAESGIDRTEIFVTSKLWNSDQGYESALRAFDMSMERLGLDYLDLYLIHWPRISGKESQWVELNRESWKAFEKLYREKKVRSIGVSNFKPGHLSSLMETAEVMPMVNQIELHPGLPQEETVKFCRRHDIIVEAWGPFSQGRLFETSALEEVARKHDKSIAQVCLRWNLQNGIIPLPKSVTPSRIRENIDVYDFELSRQDMAVIDSLTGIPWSGMDPDTAAH